jgi:hypothetical protein
MTSVGTKRGCVRAAGQRKVSRSRSHFSRSRTI